MGNSLGTHGKQPHLRGAAALVTYPDYSVARTQTTAASKVGPAMAGPTGPVPPAMQKYRPVIVLVHTAH